MSDKKTPFMIREFADLLEKKTDALRTLATVIEDFATDEQDIQIWGMLSDLLWSPNKRP